MTGQALHEAPELAGHARQTVDIVAFTAVEYVPVVQAVHAALPVTVL